MSGYFHDQSATERLVRIETKIDHWSSTLLSQDVRISTLEKNNPHPDHETRIRRLERAVYVASGIAAASGGLLGSFLSSVMGGA